MSVRASFAACRDDGVRMMALALLFVVSLGTAPASEAGGGTRDAAPFTPGQPAASSATAEMTLEQFLDRLMIAESGGNDLASNPRSSALGAYQFIEATFLEVVERHFADETGALTRAQILALRTDRVFARRAAEAFTRENAAYLVSEGHPATFPNLRLAYLVGPAAAVRVLAADGTVPLTTLLSPQAIRANPFMMRMSAADIVARCARDLSVPGNATAGLAVEPGTTPPPKPRPAIVVKCDLQRASCRHWLKLQKAKLARRQATR